MSSRARSNARETAGTVHTAQHFVAPNAFPRQPGSGKMIIGMPSLAGNTRDEMYLPRICHVQQSCRHLPALCDMCSVARECEHSLWALMNDSVVLFEQKG